MTEREFQRTVTDALTAFGWKWTHFRPGMSRKGWRTALSGAQGYPDITAVRGRRIVWLELKAEKGKLSDHQGGWLAALGSAGAEVHVVRPSDFDFLVEVLR